MTTRLGDLNFPGLAGKTAVVTGAARGLGVEIAGTLAACGVSVAIVDIDLAGAAATAEGIAGAGGRAQAFECDIADGDSVEHAYDQVIDAFGGVDILVNNAGLVRKAPLEEVSLEDWRAVMAVNLDAAFLCTQRFGHSMLERGAGSIVNVSSVAAVAPSPSRGSYSASKAALTSLTQQTAIEWGPHGVRANVVCPGIHAEAMQSVDMKRSEAQREMIPLRRFAQPADLTVLIAFLCSDFASYISGSVLTVDGGFSHVIVTELVKRAGK